MRTRFLFAFVLMGLSFTIIQGLMVRQLSVSFCGNELSIGLILGNWLVLEAVGSGLKGLRDGVGPCEWKKRQEGLSKRCSGMDVHRGPG